MWDEWSVNSIHDFVSQVTSFLMPSTVHESPGVGLEESVTSTLHILVFVLKVTFSALFKR